MIQDFTEQESFRIAKLEELKKLGINPFPSEEYKTSHNSVEILEKFPKNTEDEDFQNVSLAGRLMSIRIMGKASFGVLQ
ncbi:MAG: lysine--tRNA ligase, partial [Cytophagales bacterium]|nr:lysine--tRNA ligase [Cytophagales bacterium]